MATEKERSASEIALELKSKLKALDTHHKSLKEEKNQLEILFEEESTKCKEIEAAQKRLNSKIYMITQNCIFNYFRGVKYTKLLNIFITLLWRYPLN